MNTRIRFILMVTVVAACAAVAGLYFSGIIGPGGGGPAKKVSVPPIRLTDPFIINLADTDQVHYVKLGLALRVDDMTEADGKKFVGAGAADGSGVVTGAMNLASYAPVRDAVIETVSQFTTTQLNTADGKSQLKAELLRAARTGRGEGRAWGSPQARPVHGSVQDQRCPVYRFRRPVSHSGQKVAQHMSAHNPQAESLLTAALVRAAEVAAQRTGRSVSLVDAHMPSSTALLRFDLTFDGGAKLTWLVTNEDATGVSDLLIGGAGDRGAVLTEMHLDALSGTFSEMLEQAVEAINERLSLPLTGGNVDMGMEGAVPELVFGGSEHVSGLEIEGFGLLTVVQQANVEMTAAFTQRYQVPPEAEATHAPAFDAQPNATPASAPVSHASELTSPAADSAAHQGEAPAGEPMQPAAAAFPAADASSGSTGACSCRRSRAGSRQRRAAATDGRA